MKSPAESRLVIFFLEEIAGLDGGILAAALNRVQVFAEAFENAASLAFGKLALDFGEREMNAVSYTHLTLPTKA